MTYTVIFYQGGAQQGAWFRTFPVGTIEEARALEASIEQGGRPALVNKTAVWDAIGLPEGAPHWWDFQRCAPKRRA